MELREHSIATHDDWVAARKELLLREREFSRLGDELAKQRRALPWEPVEKTYVFQGPSGQETKHKVIHRKLAATGEELCEGFVGRDLPYLLHLRSRARSPQRRLPMARPDAEGSR